jgi:gamma-glutamyltranspeptidase/glutathione hydrolase
MRNASTRRAKNLSASARGIALGLGLLLLWPLTAWGASPDPVHARHGMAVSSSSHAAAAGAEILAAGGNAVDAAVATAFALAVTQPFSAGLGGGAFLLIRRPSGEVIALDARETAPAAATRDMYLKPGLPERASQHGPLAVAVPSFTAGMALALERYGTKSLAQVTAPAVRLAEEGFPLAPFQASRIEFMKRYITAETFPETYRIQFAPAADGRAEPGDFLVQKDLAATLRAIGKDGPGVIHGGPIGRKIVDRVQALGGILTLEDLKDYEPIVRKPVSGTYRGFTVHSFPPPSSGGAVLLETLNILEGFELAPLGPRSSQSLHLVTEAMKLAFADRATYMGDPDFVEVPVARLVSKEYADAQRARIDPDKASVVAAPGTPVDDAGTAHLSVTDRKGGAVALTMTINTTYGSGITAPGTGIVLNNEMDDFSVAPDTPNAYGLIDTRGANAIEPGKRPLSSMTPTIVEKNGKTFMVTGSPGGPRIISTVLLTLLNEIDHGMDVKAAESAPRYHHQSVPDKLRIEPEVARDVVRALERKGHVVDVSDRHWSAAEAIMIDPETGWHLGASDPRTQGAAVGPP